MIRSAGNIIGYLQATYTQLTPYSQPIRSVSSFSSSANPAYSLPQEQSIYLELTPSLATPLKIKLTAFYMNHQGPALASYLMLLQMIEKRRGSALPEYLDMLSTPSTSILEAIGFRRSFHSKS